MNNKKMFLATAMVISVLTGVYVTPVYAQSIPSDANFNVVVITPGHSATITYELDDVIWNNLSAFHVTYIFAIGAGKITARIASATAVGQFANIIYSSVGLLGITPVAGYAYTADTISLSADTGDIGFGVLFTSIIAGIGDPTFPVVMGMIVSLT